MRLPGLGRGPEVGSERGGEPAGVLFGLERAWTAHRDADQRQHGRDADARGRAAGASMAGWPLDLGSRSGIGSDQSAHSVGAAERNGFRMRGSGAGRQPGACGIGVLLPFRAARKSRDDGSGRNSGSLAGPDAGAIPGAALGGEALPPAGDPAQLRSGRNLRFGPHRAGELCQPRGGGDAGSGSLEPRPAKRCMHCCTGTPRQEASAGTIARCCAPRADCS